MRCTTHLQSPVWSKTLRGPPCRTSTCVRVYVRARAYACTHVHVYVRAWVWIYLSGQAK